MPLLAEYDGGQVAAARRGANAEVGSGAKSLEVVKTEQVHTCRLDRFEVAPIRKLDRFRAYKATLPRTLAMILVDINQQWNKPCRIIHLPISTRCPAS